MSKRIDEARRALDAHTLPDGQERRHAPAHIEYRAADAGASWRFEGDAAVFDAPSDDLSGGYGMGSFREILKRGAFKDAIKTDDVRALINHDPNLLLARSQAGQGTLQLSEKPTALRAVIPEMPDISYANDLRVLIDRGDLSQMSFGFRMGDKGEQEWQEDNDGNVVRTIHKVGEIFDVSPVTYPAYPQTSASVKSARSLCGINIFDGDDMDLERVKDVAWKVHRGAVSATEDERRQIDNLLIAHSTVSPWMAELTVRAAASEPDLMAAMNAKRAHDQITTTPDPAWRRTNARARLRLIQP